MMTPSPTLLVVLGAILGAAGQVFLKLGATGASSLADYLNFRLGAGFCMYAVGSVLWIMALSKLPLSKVYPFTVLTFVIVYLASFALLGERITGTVLLGATLVLAGLIVISLA
jgi:drug/metabolite transporter (DMT)-like permease